MNVEKITIEALGYKWVLTSNTQFADYTRIALDSAATALVWQGEVYTKPAERVAAMQLMSGYADVVSSLEGVEPLKKAGGATEAIKEDLAYQLVSDASRWLSLVLDADKNRKWHEVIALRSAATKLNPQWLFLTTDKNVSENESDVSAVAAKEVISQTEKFIDNDGSDPVTGEPLSLPDDVSLIEASSTLEEKANKTASTVARKKG